MAGKQPLVVFKNFYYLLLLFLLCINNTYAQIELPAVDIIAEQTIRLLDNITSMDFNAHHRSIVAQMILTEIHARVAPSSMYKSMPQLFKTQLANVDSLLKDSIDTTPSIQITIGSVLDKLQICNEQILDDISQQIDTTDAEIDQLKILFDSYISCMSTEIDRILSDATTANRTLEKINKKIKTVQKVYGKQKSGLFGPTVGQLLSNNPVLVERQQRTMGILQDFIEDHNTVSNNVVSIISHINDYKNEINQLSKAELLPTLLTSSLEHYIQQIENIRTYLSKTKERINENTETTTQQGKIEL